MKQLEQPNQNRNMLCALFHFCSIIKLTMSCIPLFFNKIRVQFKKLIDSHPHVKTFVILNVFTTMKCMVMIGNLLKNIKFINILLVADYEKFSKTLHDNCVKGENLLENSKFASKLKELFNKRFQIQENN